MNEVVQLQIKNGKKLTNNERLVLLVDLIDCGAIERLGNEVIALASIALGLQTQKVRHKCNQAPLDFKNQEMIIICTSKLLLWRVLLASTEKNAAPAFDSRFLV